MGRFQQDLKTLAQYTILYGVRLVATVYMRSEFQEDRMTPFALFCMIFIFGQEKGIRKVRGHLART